MQNLFKLKPIFQLKPIISVKTNYCCQKHQDAYRNHITYMSESDYLLYLTDAYDRQERLTFLIVAPSYEIGIRPS